MKREEKWLVAILLAVMTGWITSPWHGLSNTVVALGGVSAILLARVLAVGRPARRAPRLGCAGVVRRARHDVRRARQPAARFACSPTGGFTCSLGWPWQAALVALVVSYLYIHYSFASMTAHITALYPAFLTAALAAGVPPMVAALPLAYFSNLDAGITHYGTGSAPVFFGAGYVSQTDWWRIGFIISLMNLVIWLGIGMWWWKLVGLW